MGRRRPFIEVVFRLGAPEDDGRQWVTGQVRGARDAYRIGYVRPQGEAVGVYTSEEREGAGPVAVCADPSRAFGELVSAWGRQIADSPETAEEARGGG